MSSIRGQLQGTLANNTKRHIAIATCLAFTNVFIARYILTKKNSDPMERFFKYTDPKTEFERMKRKDCLQSVGPDGEFRDFV